MIDIVDGQRYFLYKHHQSSLYASMGRKKQYEDDKARCKAFYERNKDNLNAKKRDARKHEKERWRLIQHSLQEKEKELMSLKYSHLNADGRIDRAAELAQQDEPIRGATNLSEGQKLASPDMIQRKRSRRVSRKPIPFAFEFQYSN